MSGADPNKNPDLVILNVVPEGTVGPDWRCELLSVPKAFRTPCFCFICNLLTQPLLPGRLLNTDLATVTMMPTFCFAHFNFHKSVSDTVSFYFTSAEDPIYFILFVISPGVDWLKLQIKYTVVYERPHTLIQTFRSSGAPPCRQRWIPCRGCWAALMYVSVALPLGFPVTLTGVNSWRGQKSPLTLLSSHFYFLARLHSSCSLSFPRLAPLQLSFTLLLSSSLSGLRSYISDATGTGSTCSSADVCINQTEGPAVADDLTSLRLTHTHPHTHTPTHTHTVVSPWLTYIHLL